MKHRETRKAVSMTTTIAIAVLATVLAFPTMTTVAIAQSSSNDFQDFMECLFNDVGGSTATAQDIEDADVTEQQIRDCFSPIYNDSSDDNTGSSNSYNDDDDEDSSSNDDSDGSTSNNGDDEQDGTDNTDNTENDETSGTDTGGENEDTTSGSTDEPDSTDDSTVNNTE
jgi:hypothetical protein